ncbi:NAD(P)-dependent oxidoreductase (plasmid) [Rhodococcoides fascians A21d2]|uniref:NAD(P)-dependent oxidoreductase n=1 Tax=Rhodococcoides fascians TaxID=1828 RepID=UPI0013EF22C1|nr:NAD(P)-binding domain-containing protein [Rhodococcus fascians]QII03792.1 NAD(P)-dependent oxidoreductase [Rhodococcus fascians A21d2]
MVQSLCRADILVTAWNRSPDKARPLGEAGVLLADTPSAAVEGAQLIVTMLLDVEAVLEVMGSITGYVSAGTVWLQTTTLDPAEVDRCVLLADTLGLSFLDAPVLGTGDLAARGALKFLMSGPRHLHARVRSAVDAMSSATIWVNESPGSSSALKFVTDVWTAKMIAITAQSMSDAEALSVDPHDFLSAIEGSSYDTEHPDVLVFQGQHVGTFRGRVTPGP